MNTISTFVTRAIASAAMALMLLVNPASAGKLVQVSMISLFIDKDNSISDRIIARFNSDDCMDFGTGELACNLLKVSLSSGGQDFSINSDSDGGGRFYVYNNINGRDSFALAGRLAPGQADFDFSISCGNDLPGQDDVINNILNAVGKSYNQYSSSGGCVARGSIEDRNTFEDSIFLDFANFILTIEELPDDDNDGIPNNEDNCPLEPGSVSPCELATRLSSVEKIVGQLLASSNCIPDGQDCSGSLDKCCSGTTNCRAADKGFKCFVNAN